MKKFIVVFIVFALCGFNMVNAQSLKKATAAQEKSMIATINRTAASIRTIQCQFVQTNSLSFMNEKVSSHGRMYYTNRGKLRWEYVSPYKYIFIINNDKVHIVSSKKSSMIDIRGSKLFQGIARIMMNSVTGKSLSSGSDFNVDMYTYGKEWIAYLTPLKKNMKSLFKSIRLHFDTDSDMITSVDMIEPNGDTTNIKLSGAKINANINDQIFSAN